VLQQAGDLDAVFQVYDASPNPFSVLHALKSLQLRFLTPKEISRLMGFPEEFGFPPEISKRQGYKALGNSLNVWVVAILLHALLY
jgi:tRNA (cytosine38-C5)-methyltransferase